MLLELEERERRAQELALLIAEHPLYEAPNGIMSVTRSGAQSPEGEELEDLGKHTSDGHFQEVRTADQSPIGLRLANDSTQEGLRSHHGNNRTVMASVAGESSPF